MGKRTKGPGLVSRTPAYLRKTDDQTQTSQQTREPGQQASDNQTQRLQWTLEQTQLRYSELKDKSNKLMDQAAQLLGFCAISGFTTFLSKSTWAGLPNQEARVNLKKSIILLMIVVITAAFILCAFSIFLSLFDALFSDSSLDVQAPDIAEQVQEQSSVRRMTFLIQNLSDRIRKLKWINLVASLALYIMYTTYAFSLEYLILTIISSH